MYSVNTGCSDYLRERGVTRLVHVTYWCFLREILTKGLHPNVHGLDNLRLDGSRDLCFSLSIPNYRFFANRCYDRPDLEQDHVAVVIDTALTDRDDARFFETNATWLGNRGGLSGIDGIKELFAEQVSVKGGTVLRSTVSPRRHPFPPIRVPLVPNDLPTSIQAEVQFRNPIALRDLSIVFPSSEQLSIYEASCGPIPCNMRVGIDPKLFAFSKVLCPNRKSREDVWFYDDSRRIAMLHDRETYHEDEDF
jgi:hypothetical protein